MENEKKKKINRTSYNIISYDPRNLGLINITRNVVDNFFKVAGFKAPIQTLECKDCDDLVSEWNALGICNKDNEVAFRNRLETLYNKAASQLNVFSEQRRIFVTSLNIGDKVGLGCNGPIIISSNWISGDKETFATGVFHELGHMHKIPSLEREEAGKNITDDSQIEALEEEMKGRNAIFECHGEHCLNIGCSMRQRLCNINWITHLKLERDRPYCNKCIEDLKSFFSEGIQKDK